MPGKPLSARRVWFLAPRPGNKPSYLGSCYLLGKKLGSSQTTFLLPRTYATEPQRQLRHHARPLIQPSGHRRPRFAKEPTRDLLIDLSNNHRQSTPSRAQTQWTLPLHFAITDKVVILDEVHSYDGYMNTFLETTLEYLGINKVPVILLSAT